MKNAPTLPALGPWTRLAVAAALAGGLLAGWGFVVEPGRLVVRRIQVPSRAGAARR